jgi:hypothetical protein
MVGAGLWLSGATWAALHCGGAFGYHHIADFEDATVVTRFEVHDRHDNVLWRIDATRPVEIGTIDYGVVPAGFRQILPLSGKPRVLAPGEDLLTAYTTPTDWMRHEGAAVGTSAFKGGAWSAGRLSNTSLGRVFQ